MTTKVSPNTGQNADIKHKAEAAATAASEHLKTGARDMADTVSTEASNYANQAKESAADEVKGVSSALRTAANDLRSGSPQERTFSQIADGLADASEAMRDKDLGELAGDLNSFAKRNPLVFLGSAALIGFAATRFAKASSKPTGQRYDDDAMDRPAPSPRTDYSAPPTTTVTPAAPAVVTGEKS